jgi:uncharacterized protein
MTQGRAVGAVRLPVVADGAGVWPAANDPSYAALVEAGWKPSPLRLFLFKVHSRCNLDCSYCYVYRHPDQTWRSKPARMSRAVVEAAGARIREHAAAHGLAEVAIGLHGGEPLLVGADGLHDFFAALRGAVGPDLEWRASIQTNGVLLSEETLRQLARAKVRVGVSLDGDRIVNDLARLDHRGRSTYDDVRRGLELLRQPEFEACFGAILCTIQLAADPIAVYDHLVEAGAPGLDFLLPHGNWDAPPPGNLGDAGVTPYADWLIPIFDKWYGTYPKRTKVRLFEEVIHLLLGGNSGFESIGLSPVNLIVIETDGSLEGVDTLKSTFDGAARTALNVFQHAFDDVLRHPWIVARQIGERALSETCQACDLRRVCGGGYFPHRYRAANGFRNPSVFCADLSKLILHVRGRLAKDLAARPAALSAAAGGLA